MIVPFGRNTPNLKETELLTRIGFDLDKGLSLKSDGFYYLELPEKLKMDKRILSDFDSVIHISLDKIPLIRINVTVLHRSLRKYINFELNETNIKKYIPADDKPKQEVSMRACL